ncbi:hypothetical protein CPB83DRAFT_897766 [Crepidotus variabilis]|uniref:Uncharacterized protein n=1 Tax=Crepidotus variabilis TaxID=179855 RepID=A0A9P6JLC9_9AGAR|nr:hypothetical protein CPB83DRAFT_897766 [Crepidotus variabilis]
MYVSTKALRKPTICGALTSWQEWIFPFIKQKLEAKSQSAEHWEFQILKMMTIWPPGIEEVSNFMCNTITGIIAHWVQVVNGHEDIGDSDSFNTVTLH